MGSVSKGDFAAMISVSPARVSQFLKDGKIHGPALEGEGHRSRIHPDIAIRQLAISIDPAQGYGANGKAALARPAKQESFRTQPAPTVPVTDVFADKLAQERLKQQKLKTAQMERAEKAEAGIYMLTAAARAEMTGAVSDAFKVMEQGIPDMATAIAEEFGIPQRDAQKTLLRKWRDIRARAAKDFREQSEGVEDTLVTMEKDEDA
ncbi:MAG: hypothetical protein ABGX47_23780 [Martelella sp.]|uniref:hypothetical protein n=1 Tax=Martelella sp. TaxID=1969699 RepID=UPI0032425D36